MPLLRTLAVLALLAFLSSRGYCAENAKLDFEFSQRVEAGKVTVGEMLRRLNLALPRLQAGDEESTLYFAETYGSACAKAEGKQVQELERILRALPVESFLFDGCFPAYATTAIKRRVAELAKKPVHLEWKPGGEELPEELRDAPGEFQEAWKVYSAVGSVSRSDQGCRGSAAPESGNS